MPASAHAMAIPVPIVPPPIIATDEDRIWYGGDIKVRNLCRLSLGEESVSKSLGFRCVDKLCEKRTFPVQAFAKRKCCRCLYSFKTGPRGR